MLLRSKKNSIKTLIGVLASHDDGQINRTLVALFEYLYHHRSKGDLERFHFVFTGGTHDRIFYGDKKEKVAPLSQEVAEWIRDGCGVTTLPGTDRGGVTVLSYLISQRQCSIVWPFFSAKGNHWLRPENLAFMRLCDHWRVKRLMNRGSVLVWCDSEIHEDAKRNLQSCPPRLTLLPHTADEARIEIKTPAKRRRVLREIAKPPHPRWADKRTMFADMRVALIAHDEMKSKMIEFAVDHEAELYKFKGILATGTTSREVAAATSRLHEKIERYHSGPKGGDIEIATQVLYSKCQIVIFFIDPSRPHPHIDDIRVVFEACMIKDDVILITNEIHAREFMSWMVRGNESLVLYPER